MPEHKRRPILANGERYVTSETKPSRGGPLEMPRTYEEARIVVKKEVATALEKFASLPPKKRRSDEAILCLRLHPDMVAKTYDPEGIFSMVRDLENVGSRSYKVASKDVAQTERIKKQLEKETEEVTGRLVFVRSSDAGFHRLIRALDISASQVPRSFKEDIQRIERFDLLAPAEQLLGFPADWRGGRVELVLHPSRHDESEQLQFLLDVFPRDTPDPKKIRVATYEDGPTFVSARISRSALEELAGMNPLRTAHPLVFGGFEDLRAAPTFPAPPPPTTTTRSTIKVGMFDGGIDPNHPLLKGHAEQDDSLSIRCPANPDCVAHGIAVAGALLYGPLNERDTKSPLPAPPVYVVSFRAMPTSDPSDIDLYECIDVIEAAVPARRDVRTFNVSFGPRGPIADDEISRFTYALDTLAVTQKVTFCVAAGNDGDAGADMERVQAPADLANGLGVGAYTVRAGVRVHAPYSCKGPGRECAKVKPDLVAPGGCDQSPIHLVSATPGLKVLSYGTSFASPIVAAAAARAAESFDRSSALLGRALLIHTAEHPDRAPDYLLGHGIVRPDADAVLRCDANEVTIIFQGDIAPRKMVRLPVMLPAGVTVDGKIAITWTIAALPRVMPNHPTDYTSCCIDDTFYPNANVFNYVTDRRGANPKSRRLHKVRDAAEITELLDDGWKESAYPSSASGNAYKTEHERRALDCKWEPIVRRRVSKLGGSVEEPFLVLHAIPRNGATVRMDYAAVVTISAPRYRGDLYDAVLRRYTALQPIRVRTQAELRVRI